jgi:transposase
LAQLERMQMGALLDRHFSTHGNWQGLSLIRVYDLGTERVRIDSTTAIGYGVVSEEGLFQFGHSKDHRPDLPQLKVNVAALDPLGLPLNTAVVAGQTADDSLYRPEIARVQ